THTHTHTHTHTYTQSQHSACLAYLTISACLTSIRVLIYKIIVMITRTNTHTDTHRHTHNRPDINTLRDPEIQIIGKHANTHTHTHTLTHTHTTHSAKRTARETILGLRA